VGQRSLQGSPARGVLLVRHLLVLLTLVLLAERQQALILGPE
jgi:hypothetical protein